MPGGNRRLRKGWHIPQSRLYIHAQSGIEIHSVGKRGSTALFITYHRHKQIAIHHSLNKAFLNAESYYATLYPRPN